MFTTRVFARFYKDFSKMSKKNVQKWIFQFKFGGDFSNYFLKLFLGKYVYFDNLKKYRFSLKQMNECF